MDEETNTLVVQVRASTQGFQADIEKMRGAVDTTLTGGFSKAGDVLERGLLAGVEWRPASLTLYVLNPDDARPIFIVALGVSLEP